MRNIEDVEFRRIRFSKLYNPFKTAIEEFDQYQCRKKAPNVQVKRKHTDMNIYDVQVTIDKNGLIGKCIGPHFEHHRDGVCKHVYIVAFRTIQQWLVDKKPKDFHFLERNVICEDIEDLLTVPSLDKPKLRTAYTVFMEVEAEEPFHEIKTPPKAGDDFVDDFDSVPTDTKKKSPTILPPEVNLHKEVVFKKADQFAETLHEIVKEPLTDEPLATPGKKDELPGIPVKVNSKALQKKDTFPAAFGGTYKDIPKNLVVMLGGKPYVTKAGLVYAASGMGLVAIQTEPVSWTWENEDGRSVFQATVIFNDGRKFSSHGVAIPIKENVKMKTLWGCIDHVAETRSVARALRNALAFGEPAVEEMPTFEG